MKVVLVSLARRGGMVHFLAELAEGLAPFVDVAVVVSAHAELNYLSRDIDRKTLDTGTNRFVSVARFLSPATWFHLAAIIRGFKADVVHIAGVHEWNPLVAILCRLQRLPVVYTVHDPELHPGAPWRLWIGDLLTSSLSRRLVALTELGRRQLLNRGEPPDRVAVIPHPMYTIFRRWKPRARSAQKLILYFGRLQAYKGLDVLIRAFQSVRPSLPGWKLIVAGDGQLPPDLDSGASLGIEVINRYLTDKEVAQLMSRCSIVALPYISATQSGVVALAQAFRRPVVATAVGGLKEMVVQGRTGVLVRPGDARAFGTALKSLAGNGPRRSRMQREIRRIAEGMWSPKVIARAYLDAYAIALHRTGTE